MKFLDEPLKISRMVGAVLINVILITIVAYAFGTSSETALQQLGIEFSSAYILALLLFPFSTLQLGVWAGCSAWIFGGFIGGIISKNTRLALLISVISVIPYYFIALIIASQLGFTQTNLFDLILLPEFITAFGINLFGALVGTRIEKKYF